MIGAQLRCAGCQARLPWRHPDPWRCPQAGLSRPPSQDHDHDHDRDRELVLVVAWSLHELPPVTTTKGAAADHAAPQPEPASAASVDAAFMALLNFKPPAPAAVNTSDDLLALLLGPPG